MTDNLKSEILSLKFVIDFGLWTFDFGLLKLNRRSTVMLIQRLDLVAFQCRIQNR